METNIWIDALAKQAAQGLQFQPTAQPQAMAQPQTQAAKYTHSFDNTPVQKNGQTYNGTHKMSFEAPAANQGSLMRQANEAIDRNNAFAERTAGRGSFYYGQQPQQFGGGGFNNAGVSTFAGTNNLVGANRNPLANSVNATADAVMQRTVIPQGNRRHATKLISTLADVQYKQGALNEQAMERQQRDAHYGATSNVQQQQFDRTYEQKDREIASNSNKYLELAQYKVQEKMNDPRNQVARGNLFDDTYNGIYSKEEAEYLDGDDALKSQARAHYQKTGQYPQFEKYTEKGNFWDSDKYRIAQPKQQGAVPQYGNVTAEPLNNEEAERFAQWKAIQEAKAKHNAILNQ